MICPSCGRRVADDALACPDCGTPLDMTRKMSLSGATWCPACGALAAPGATECPKCGTALTPAGRPERRRRDIELPEIGNTGMMDPVPDIESAIPPEDDAGARRADRLPRTRAIVLATLLSVVVVGGAALLITHPWDPQATRISATTPADTSMQGFPGFLESLTGQDTETEGAQTKSVAEALTEAHESLGELAGRVDESEELLRGDGVAGRLSDDEVAAAADAALGVSLDVSNAISGLSELDDGKYPDALSGLMTLGSWLRNRCDALTEAWDALAASDDPSADADQIISGLDASSDYARRFDQAYDAWTLDGEKDAR